MEPDNLYLNDGAYFAEPAEQVAERVAEKDQVLSNAPQLREIADRLKARVADLDSPRTLLPEDLKDNQRFMHVMAGRKMAIEILSPEIDYLEQLLNEYIEE